MLVGNMSLLLMEQRTRNHDKHSSRQYKVQTANEIQTMTHLHCISAGGNEDCTQRRGTKVRTPNKSTNHHQPMHYMPVLITGDAVWNPGAGNGYNNLGTEEQVYETR